MDEFKNKTEGTVKEEVGKATGDRDLETRGEGQKLVGDAEGAARNVGGKVEEAAGKVTGDRNLEEKGEERQY